MVSGATQAIDVLTGVRALLVSLNIQLEKASEWSSEDRKEIQLFVQSLKNYVSILQGDNSERFYLPEPWKEECLVQKLKEATKYVQLSLAGSETNRLAPCHAAAIIDLFNEMTLKSILPEPRMDAPSKSNFADGGGGGGSSTVADDMFHDPITYELMSDPVKASDGHTYDRWTILDNNLTQSPFDQRRDRAFFIACDDLNVRSALFERFPAVLRTFHERRRAFRAVALDLARQPGKHDDDFRLQVIKLLSHVLEWDPDDAEVQEEQDALVGKLTTSVEAQRLLDTTSLSSKRAGAMRIFRYKVLPQDEHLLRSSRSLRPAAGVEQDRGQTEHPVAGLFGCILSTVCCCVVMCCVLCSGRGDADDDAV